MNANDDIRSPKLSKEYEKYKAIYELFGKYEGSLVAVSKDLGVTTKEAKQIAMKLMPQSFRKYYDIHDKELFQAEVYASLLKSNYDVLRTAQDMGLSSKTIIKTLKKMQKYDEYLEKRGEIDREKLDYIIDSFLKNKRYIARTAQELKISPEDLRTLRQKYFPHISINKLIPKRENLSISRDVFIRIIDGFEGNFKYIAQYLKIDEVKARYYAKRICPEAYERYHGKVNTSESES